MMNYINTGQIASVNSIQCNTRELISADEIYTDRGEDIPDHLNTVRTDGVPFLSILFYMLIICWVMATMVLNFV